MKTCRFCGVELTEANHYRKTGDICKGCHNKNRHYYLEPFYKEQPAWTIDKLIDDLTIYTPTWRLTAMFTFDAFAENGVHASQESIDAINKAFDDIDAAIKEIVPA